MSRVLDYLTSKRTIVGISSIVPWLLFGSLIGLISGAGAILFTFGIQFFTDLFYGEVVGYHIPGLATETPHAGSTALFASNWLFFVVPTAGGLLVGWLVYAFAPEAEGHGTDEVIKAFHRDRGIIRRRVPFVKTIASILTISTGGSAGREGPVAQIGAGFGSFLADVLKLPDKDRRLMVVAGMGGGIGSIFRAPLGGAIFATEVMYREPDFEYEGLVPAIISAIVAYSLYGYVYGWGAIFDTPKLLFHEPAHLLLYLIFGIISAVVGIAYVRLFYGIRDKIFRKLPIKKHFRPAVGGLLLGILAYFFPPILGGGYGWIQLAIYGQVALGTMLLFPVLKILATSLTIGSGGSGGVFAPSLVIGGMLGGAFGEACRMLFPTWGIEPAAFIMVGMAGFFAGIAKVPISSLILVAEMTGSYGLLVPTMLVATVTLLLTGKTSIYERQVPHRGQSPAHRGEFLMGVLESISVRECMIPTESTQLVPENLVLNDLLKVVPTTNHQYYFTVDEHKRLKGSIAMDDVRRVMFDPNVGNFLVARDLALPRPPRLTLQDRLTTALDLFTLHSVDELPVINGDSGEVIGIMRKKDLVVVYDQTLLRKRMTNG